MKYKIIKNNTKEEDETYTYLFVGYENNPQIKSNILNKWKKLSNSNIKTEYEDFLIIALSVYSLDKKIPRKNSGDAWTREFDVSIPVIEYEKWNSNLDKINRLLNFLTGDLWKVSFYKTEERYYHNRRKMSHKIKNYNFDCVSLFSGGLDSFCGSIYLASQGKNILFVGNEEYPKLKQKQEDLINVLKTEFTSINLNLETFTASPRDTRFIGENTSRSRSILFIAAAFVFASLNNENNIPVYIPENGFIGLNIPLTISRTGSCSTRTTHPFFINLLNDILRNVGIRNELINPFKFLSKNELVNIVKDTNSFIDGYKDTYSCSHPTLPRYKKLEYPKNCGYCYPCLIRRASLINIDDKSNYWYDINNETHVSEILNSQKKSDLIAVINTFKRYCSMSDDELKSMIKNSSPLTNEETQKFYLCYKETLQAIKKLLMKSKINLDDFEDF